MEDDFLSWHELKSSIDDKKNVVLFQEQEIWWCSVGKNIGREQDGKNELFERPVLILCKFSHEVFWGIPLSTKNKIGRYYFTFPFKGKIETAVLSQLRVMSHKRLTRKMGKISDNEFKRVKEAIICLIKNKSFT